MGHKYFKHAGLAALLLGCSVGLAQADSPTPPPQSPDQLRALLGHSGTAKASTGGAGLAAKGAACTTSWQPYWCTSSQTFWDGSSSIVWAFNTDGSVFSWTSGGDLLATNGEALINACNTGHLYWLFITSTSCTWSATFNTH